MVAFSFKWNLLPPPLMKVFSYNPTNYSTRQKYVPLKRKCNHKPLSDSFIAKGPRLWDNVTTETRNSVHIKSFCSKIKNKMIEKY